MTNKNDWRFLSVARLGVVNCNRMLRLLGKVLNNGMFQSENVKTFSVNNLLVVLKTDVAFMIFQSHRDIEAEDNQSLKS